MNRPSFLLVISAVIYFAVALLLLFAPEEVLVFAGAPASILDRTLLQIIGSAIFGFAMLNWLNRYGRVGGIFGRPVVAGNLAHAGTAGLLLANVARRGAFSTPVIVALLVYGSLAFAFGFAFVRPAAEAGRDDGSVPPTRPPEGAGR